MEPAVKSSLLWGLVGALAFLVLVQGYQIVAGEFVGVGPLLGATLVVWAGSAAATHLLRPRVRRRAKR
jgi:hypothetical protein